MDLVECLRLSNLAQRSTKLMKAIKTRRALFQVDNVSSPLCQRFHKRNLARAGNVNMDRCHKTVMKSRKLRVYLPRFT